MKQNFYCHLIGLLIFFGFNFNLNAQTTISPEPRLNIQGEIYFLDAPFPGVSLTVTQDSITNEKFYTDNNGHYSLELAIGHYYLIEVSKEGYYSKYFSVDSKNIPAERLKKEFAVIQADLYMVKDDGILNFINSKNGGLLQKYFYDKEQNDFSYDAEYSLHSMEEMMAFREVIESVENNPSIKKYFDLYKNQLVETQNAVKEEAYQKKIKEQELKQERQQRIYLYAGLILLIVFAGFMFNRYKITQKQKHIIEIKEKETQQQNSLIKEQKLKVELQKHLLEEKQKEILDSITYAERLQKAILPPKEFINKNLPDNFIYYKPKDIVAGDFYWAQKINDSFIIASADCTGHGVPGALVSVVCSNALNRSVKEFGMKEPGQILYKTRELVIETFEKSDADVKDGMDISLLCVDTKNKKVSWSGAYNPLWYVVDKELKEIKADKQPIGKTENPAPFLTHTMGYKEGTTFYLFTDGLADQFGGPKGKKYKYKQFEDLLLSINDKTMQQQCSIIDQSFESWKGGFDQVDDVCVIGIRV